MRLRRFVASARRRLRLRGDAGMSVVEVGVAMMVMSVAVTGVIGSMGSGLHLVGESRQRTAGTAVAQERLERAKNVPYSRVALYESPAHSTEAGNPDNAVTAGRYQVDGSTSEALVVCTSAAPCDGGAAGPVSGALKHIDDPVTLGTTEFNVYQYVTWHIDPAISTTVPAYKRVVVIVTWKFPVNSGPTNRVVASTFIGPGGVIVAAATPTPTATATAAPSASPIVTPPPSPEVPACGTITILSGTGAVQGYTNSRTVQVQLAGTATCTPTSVDLSNDKNSYTRVATSFPATVTWSIPPGDGTKTVYAKFAAGEATPTITWGTISLDQTRPPTVTNLRTASCSISGNSRTIGLTWDGNATSDANFLGYRVYKSVESSTFGPLLTTGAQAATDTDSKGYTLMRFIVRAYDKAGNESVDSNVLPFSKNAC